MVKGTAKLGGGSDEQFFVRVEPNKKPVSYTHLTLPTSDLV